MSDGYWSASPRKDVRRWAFRDAGAWYWVKFSGVFWVSGNVNDIWSTLGGESGMLGAPQSDWNPTTGEQAFERGYIYWTGTRYMVSPTAGHGLALAVQPPPQKPAPPAADIRRPA